MHELVMVKEAVSALILSVAVCGTELTGAVFME